MDAINNLRFVTCRKIARRRSLSSTLECHFNFIIVDLWKIYDSKEEKIRQKKNIVHLSWKKGGLSEAKHIFQ